MSEELPEGWEWKELKNVCEITSSKRIYQNEYISEGIPFYRSKEIIELSEGKAISLELFISKKRYEELKNKFGTPEKDDILITAVGTIGVSYVLPDNRNFYFKDGNLLWLRKLSRANPKYLNYFFNYFFKNKKGKMSSGSAYKALTINKLKRLSVPIPPLETQKKLVAILEKAEQIQRLQGEVDKHFDELIKSIFIDMFGDPVTNPKGWESRLLGELSEFAMGGTPDPKYTEYYNGDINWIKGSDINKEFIYTVPNKITELGLKNSTAKIYDVGTVLIGRTGQGKTRGKTAILRVKSSTNETVIAIIPNMDKILPEYIHYNLKLRYKELRDIGGDQKRGGITQKNLNNLQITSPPLKIQYQLVNIIKKVEQMKVEQESSKERIEHLFNSLIQKAFKGELVN